MRLTGHRARVTTRVNGALRRRALPDGGVRGWALESTGSPPCHSVLSAGLLRVGDGSRVSLGVLLEGRPPCCFRGRLWFSTVYLQERPGRVQVTPVSCLRVRPAAGQTAPPSGDGPAMRLREVYNFKTALLLYYNFFFTYLRIIDFILNIINYLLS